MFSKETSIFSLVPRLTMGFNTADGIFREPEKIDTQLEDKWRKTAIVICYFSIAATLALGIAFFGK